MLRRPLVLLAALAAALSLAAPALGARVSIRVEGRTQTIFAAAPRLVDAANPLQALELASLAGEFHYHVTQTPFGPYVDQIGRFAASGADGWLFKVNGVSPPVGADSVQLRDGDSVLWYHAVFGSDFSGPPTLVLTRVRPNCYRAVAQDDTGRGSPAAGATLVVDSRRRVRANASGVACVGAHRGLVRATLPGAVRSNALR